MLVIRKAQLDALAEDARRRFARELATYLRASYPQVHRAPDAELDALVEEAFQRAKTLGITIFEDVTTVAEALVVAGPRFEDAAVTEDFGDLVRDPAVPGRAKAAWLRRTVLGEGRGHGT